MRSIWSGSLSFGLVNIPVKLYTAVDGNTLSFDLLHKKDYSPIRYAKVCKAEGKEIPYAEVVKGYELQKGDYVVLQEEDFLRANVKKTKTIDVVDFVNEEEIDPMYFEKPYYLEPDKTSSKAYVLLNEALKKSKKVGIATFVIRSRQHLGIIKAKDGIIVLDQMRYQNEIRDAKDIKVEESKVSENEIKMALALIEQLSGSFDPKKYKDTYTEDLKNIIERKAKGEKVQSKGEEPRATDVSDIMKLLKESLEKTKTDQGISAQAQS